MTFQKVTMGIHRGIAKTKKSTITTVKVKGHSSRWIDKRHFGTGWNTAAMPTRNIAATCYRATTHCAIIL